MLQADGQAEPGVATRIGAFYGGDGRAAVFIAVQVVEGGLAGIAGFGSGGVLHIGTSRSRTTLFFPCEEAPAGGRVGRCVSNTRPTLKTYYHAGIFVSREICYHPNLFMLF